MDSLINCLEKFNLNSNQIDFDNELDNIIGKLSNVKVYGDQESDLEWEILCQNYSKLKYLGELFVNFSFKSEKFFISIDVFFDSIDSTNERYIDKIDWYSPDEFINNKAMEARFFLKQSLNIYDHNTKFEYILKAYEQLIYIAEYYRDEKFADILDQDFIESFTC